LEPREAGVGFLGDALGVEIEQPNRQLVSRGSDRRNFADRHSMAVRLNFYMAYPAALRVGDTVVATSW